jgi:anaerobic selenocysteine-containing dehydrogenase
MHPTDAAARGLTDGCQARVFNERGEFQARVVLSERVRPGVVATTKGRWPRHLAGRSNVNATVAERDSDMGGGAVFHDNRVEVALVLDAACAGLEPSEAVLPV